MIAAAEQESHPHLILPIAKERLIFFLEDIVTFADFESAHNRLSSIIDPLLNFEPNGEDNYWIDIARELTPLIQLTPQDIPDNNLHGYFLFKTTLAHTCAYILEVTEGNTKTKVVNVLKAAYTLKDEYENVGNNRLQDLDQMISLMVHRKMSDHPDDFFLSLSSFAVQAGMLASIRIHLKRYNSPLLTTIEDIE